MDSEARERRAGRQKETAGQGEERRRRGARSPTQAQTPLARTQATAGHQQDRPRNPTGPSERECVPASAPQSASARCARHTQAKQGTHAAPHTSTHHHTKHDSFTANTHARQRASRCDQASQCPQRNSRRPDGRVSTRQQTQPLPATKVPPFGWTYVRPAVNPAPAGYKNAAVRIDVCAPGSEPSCYQLQNSRRPD